MTSLLEVTCRADGGVVERVVVLVVASFVTSTLAHGRRPIVKPATSHPYFSAQ